MHAGWMCPGHRISPAGFPPGCRAGRRRCSRHTWSTTPPPALSGTRKRSRPTGTCPTPPTCWPAPERGPSPGSSRNAGSNLTGWNRSRPTTAPGGRWRSASARPAPTGRRVARSAERSPSSAGPGSPPPSGPFPTTPPFPGWPRRWTGPSSAAACAPAQPTSPWSRCATGPDAAPSSATDCPTGGSCSGRSSRPTAPGASWRWPWPWAGPTTPGSGWPCRRAGSPPGRSCSRSSPVQRYGTCS